MVSIKIEANGFSSKAKTTISTEVKSTNLLYDDIAEKLGSMLYAVEEMGFDFSTDEVYKKAMESVSTAKFGQKYVTVLSQEGLKVSIRSV